MAFQEEDAKILVKLGLTISEAKVYLSLLKFGQTTGKALSQGSRLARQEVYRILCELHKKGLVEKVIAAPTLFKPVPIEDCLQMLIGQRKSEVSETEYKASLLLEKFKEVNYFVSQEKESFFILVPEKEAYRRKFRFSIDNARVSCDMLLHWECFRYGMVEDAEIWEKTVEQGVKTRFIVYNSKEEKTIERVIRSLSRKGSFEVRSVFAPPPATIAIFDGRDACITTSPMLSPDSTSSLWSNNSGLIAVFQNYFDSMWSSSMLDGFRSVLGPPVFNRQV